MMAGHRYSGELHACTCRFFRGFAAQAEGAMHVVALSLES